MWHSREGNLDRELIAGAWTLNRQIRLIGTNDDSALRRDHLIDGAQLAKLVEWLRIVDDLVETTLRAPRFSAAIRRYAFYLDKYGATGAHPSFEALFREGLDDEPVSPLLRDEEDWRAGLDAFERMT